MVKTHSFKISNISVVKHAKKNFKNVILFEKYNYECFYLVPCFFFKFSTTSIYYIYNWKNVNLLLQKLGLPFLWIVLFPQYYY